MENESNNKMTGKVSDYDGYYGYIDTADEKYLLMKSEMLDNNTVVGDIVSFTPETYISNKYRKKVARFVRKLEKKSYKNQDIGIFSKE